MPRPCSSRAIRRRCRARSSSWRRTPRARGSSTSAPSDVAHMFFAGSDAGLGEQDRRLAGSPRIRRSKSACARSTRASRRSSSARWSATSGASSRRAPPAQRRSAAPRETPAATPARRPRRAGNAGVIAGHGHGGIGRVRDCRSRDARRPARDRRRRQPQRPAPDARQAWRSRRPALGRAHGRGPRAAARRAAQSAEPGSTGRDQRRSSRRWRNPAIAVQATFVATMLAVGAGEVAHAADAARAAARHRTIQGNAGADRARRAAGAGVAAAAADRSARRCSTAWSPPIASDCAPSRAPSRPRWRPATCCVSRVTRMLEKRLAQGRRRSRRRCRCPSARRRSASCTRRWRSAASARASRARTPIAPASWACCRRRSGRRIRKR